MALSYGYEIESTKEEKLYDYYVDLMESEAKLEMNNQSGSQFRQGWMSVEKTLEILGITVPGINS
ncbi:hypothetical protein D3C85_1832950 [compost metagenome]